MSSHNPYPGLRPFTSDERQFYVGREIVSRTLETHVSVSPLTLFFARSGVGKSSFLRCRLIPSLENRGVSYINEWGGKTFEAAVTQAATNLEENKHNDNRSVLILDQFEDVFKRSGSRKLLWESLADIVNIDDRKVHVLISMREEWLGAWEEATGYLPPANNSLLRLSPLSSREVRRAITRPTEVEGSLRFESGLVEVLSEDLITPNAYGLGDGYVEPGLLQVVCNRLWEEAETKGDGNITLSLYESLGRADTIIREFVWSKLSKVENSDSRFSSADRVLFVGMTRHLVVSQGVKAIVNRQLLANKLRMEDLGLAGPAVIQATLGAKGRKYFETSPERRIAIPDPSTDDYDLRLQMLAWIGRVLEKSVSAGFTKRQRGLQADGSRDLENIYELSHDSIGTILQQFAIDFEAWIQSRYAKLLGAIIGLLLGLPLFVVFVIPFLIEMFKSYGAIRMLLGFGFILLIVAFYGVVMWLADQFMKWLYRLIFFPIIRRLAKDEVPLKTRGKK
jgi:hypothetical protein